MSSRYLLLLIPFYVTFHNPELLNHFETQDNGSNYFEATAEKVLKGKSLYEKNCLACHGTKGKGDGSAGVYLVPRPFDLNTDKVQTQNDSILFKKITIGKAPMPSFSKLSSEARVNLVLYIRDLAKNNLKQSSQNAAKK